MSSGHPDCRVIIFVYPSLYCPNVILHVKYNTFHSEHVGSEWDFTLVLYDVVLGLKYIYLVRISLIVSTINREVRLEVRVIFAVLTFCVIELLLSIYTKDLIYSFVKLLNLTLRFTLSDSHSLLLIRSHCSNNWYQSRRSQNHCFIHRLFLSTFISSFFNCSLSSSFRNQHCIADFDLISSIESLFGSYLLQFLRDLFKTIFNKSSNHVKIRFSQHRIQPRELHRIK